MAFRKFPVVSVEYFNSLVRADKHNSDQIVINPDTRHAEAALIFLGLYDLVWVI